MYYTIFTFLNNKFGLDNTTATLNNQKHGNITFNFYQVIRNFLQVNSVTGRGMKINSYVLNLRLQTTQSLTVLISVSVTVYSDSGSESNSTSLPHSD